MVQKYSKTSSEEDRPDLTHTLMHLSDACSLLGKFTEFAQAAGTDDGHSGASPRPKSPDLARTLSRLAGVRHKAAEPDANVLSLLMRAPGILREHVPEAIR